jgi:hypothetical protein
VECIPPQLKTCPEQNDDESDFPEVSRNRHHVGSQDIQGVGADHHTYHEHPDKTWQTQTAKKRIGQKAGKNDEGEAEGQDKLLMSE